MDKHKVTYHDQFGTIVGSMSYVNKKLYLQLYGIDFPSIYMYGFSPENHQ
ncbi:MAG: hypothetical protein QNL61_10005 [Crocinitomicaceae bacterium]